MVRAAPADRTDSGATSYFRLRLPSLTFFEPLPHLTKLLLRGDFVRAAVTMDFVTLGMFILDDIYPPPSAIDQAPRISVPGGAGTYCAVGARLLSPPPNSKKIGWIVDCGNDFPDELRANINSWDTCVLLRPRVDATTRGWNGYGPNEHRDFKYLTPKIRITEDDLTSELLASRSFHMVCSQDRAVELCTGISRRRMQTGLTLGRPVFLYEPSPDCAIPSALNATLATLQHVDVISPNHSELASLFAQRDSLYHPDGEVDTGVIEKCAAQLLDHASKLNRSLTVVVRCGKDGCYVVTNQPDTPSVWLPAFHRAQVEVKDPTGGGNGFLGGFAVGLVRTGDVWEAAIWGTIAASFCIEQVGVPQLVHLDDGREMWNGCSPQERLVSYKNSIS